MKVFRAAVIVGAFIFAGPQGAALAAAAFSAIESVGRALSPPRTPRTTNAARDRLQFSLDPRTPRKFVFGRTAMAADVRDQELSTDQDFLHRFVVVASHAVNSIEEIWFDDKLAWTAAGGAQGDYAGYLLVNTRLEGSAANAINIGPRMGSSRRFTGLAYVHLRYKLTGNSKKSPSPFQQATPSRVTIVGRGAKVYDPRLDSTVPGGSGPQRANDQSTWTWDESAARNPALQLLWYLLGWRINGRLAVGKGTPPERINLESFITAANLCDEPVTLATGGTEPRYRGDGVFSEGDATGAVIDQFKAAMDAELDDVDGRLRLLVRHNDLGAPVADFSEDDILDEFNWNQTAPLEETANVVRGTYINPTTAALFQPVDYPEVRIDSLDGVDRVDPVDLQLVQSPSQAQRLAKQRLARNLYQGTFTATFGHRAWKVQRFDVVRLTFAPLGWTDKLFRVVDTAVQADGRVPMTLREEHPDIYLWDAEEAPAVQPAEPSTYDPINAPLYTLLADFAGTSNAVVYIYQRATSTPPLPSATVTFTFATGAISGLDNGWSATIPAGTDPLYIAGATASDTGESDTIAPNEWSTPVVLVGDGTQGADGLNSATVFLYQRTTGAPPALPSANVNYNFASAVATGVNNGWSQTVPDTGGAVLWVTTATAVATGNADTITPGEWAAVRVLAQDGASAFAATLDSFMRRTGNTFSAVGGNGVALGTELVPQARASAVLPAQASNIQIGLINADGLAYLLATEGWFAATATPTWFRVSPAGNVDTNVQQAAAQVFGVEQIGTEMRGFINGTDIGAIATGIPADRPHRLYLKVSGGDAAENVTFARGGAPGASAFAAQHPNVTRNGNSFFNPTGSLADVIGVELTAQARVTLQVPDATRLVALNLRDANLNDWGLWMGSWFAGSANWRLYQNGISQPETSVLPANGQVIEVAHRNTEMRAIIDGVDVGAIATGIPADRAHRLYLRLGATAGADHVTFARAGDPGPPGQDGDPGEDGAPAIGFVQDDEPGPGAFVSQTWYRPTSREWYRWTGSAWAQILGDLAAQDLIADSAFIGDGVIINAKIGDLEVDNAKIANLTLGTAKVQQGAISDIATYTAFNQSIATLGATYTNIGTVTVVSGDVVGQACVIAFNMIASRQGSQDDVIDVRCVRQGGLNVVLPQGVTGMRVEGGNRPYPVWFVDTDVPANQSVTYVIQARSTGGGSPFATLVTIVAQLAKR